MQSIPALPLFERQLKALNNILSEYDEQVEGLAQTPQYKTSLPSA
ncbi:MAG: hypothetical protein P8163_10850 [Candidatus Thiodiazotropha sp.]